MVEICDKCGQKVKKIHKESMNKNLLDGLKTAAASIQASKTNNFDLHEIVDQYNLYNNFQKLRYFGLVHYYRHPDTKQRVRGHWLITRNGWSFLRGEIEVHKWVKVCENAIDSRSIETIGVKDVYRGSDAIQTTFEYFDDDGTMIGVRPFVQPNPQIALPL